MCASYGLSDAFVKRDAKSRVPFESFEPLDQPANMQALSEWSRMHEGRASITGRRARNLNPLVHAQHGARELAFGWWWLHQGGAPAPFSAFNSRDDKLLRSWRTPFQHRALLPATWYVEKGKRFELDGGGLFALAAIMAPVQLPNGDALLSYSLVTRAAVAEAATVHDRMPMALPADFHTEWLHPSRRGDETLVQAAVAASSRLSSRFRVVEDHPHPAPTAPGQPTLF